jgi:hypothetical protein
MHVDSGFEFMNIRKFSRAGVQYCGLLPTIFPDISLVSNLDSAFTESMYELFQTPRFLSSDLELDMEEGYTEA